MSEQDCLTSLKNGLEIIEKLNLPKVEMNKEQLKALIEYIEVKEREIKRLNTLILKGGFYYEQNKRGN